MAGSTFYSYGYTNYAFTYQANEANNLTTLRSQTDIGYNADNQPTSAISSTVFGFDDDGNTRTYNNVPGYTFDVENRISGYGGGPVISYNPDGLRGVDATSGSPVFYFYDGDHLLYEVTDGGPTIAYGWGAAGINQKADIGSGAVVAYAYDPQGSVVSSYDDYANWRDLYFYDAFGQLRAGYATYFVGGQNLSAGLDKFYGDGFDNVGFGGQWGYYTDYPSFGADYGRGRSYHVGPDQATGGRLLLGHRYYDPLLARFLSRDPIGYEGGINLYAYCDNNPIMGSDPDGLGPIPSGATICPKCHGKGYIGGMRVYEREIDVGIGVSTIEKQFLWDYCDECNCVGYIPRGGWAGKGKFLPSHPARATKNLPKRVKDNVNDLGKSYGCASCGTKAAGQPNWTPDHVMPQSLLPNMLDGAHAFYFQPHCVTCYNNQAQVVRAFKRKLEVNQELFENGFKGTPDNLSLPQHTKSFVEVHNQMLLGGFVQVR